MNHQYVSCTSSIINLICPQKFCITFIFHFSCVLQPSQEKLKTMLMQTLVQVANKIWHEYQARQPKMCRGFWRTIFSSSLCEISVCLIHQNYTNFLWFTGKFDAENLHLKMEELKNLRNSVYTKKVGETCVFSDTAILFWKQTFVYLSTNFPSQGKADSVSLLFTTNCTSGLSCSKLG